MAVYKVSWVEYKCLVIEADNEDIAKDIASEHGDEDGAYSESDNWVAEPSGIPESEADFNQHLPDLKSEDPLE